MYVNNVIKDSGPWSISIRGSLTFLTKSKFKLTFLVFSERGRGNAKENFKNFYKIIFLKIFLSSGSVVEKNEKKLSQVAQAASGRKAPYGVSHGPLMLEN